MDLLCVTLFNFYALMISIIDFEWIDFFLSFLITLFLIFLIIFYVLCWLTLEIGNISFSVLVTKEEQAFKWFNIKYFIVHSQFYSKLVVFLIYIKVLMLFVHIKWYDSILINRNWEIGKFTITCFDLNFLKSTIKNHSKKLNE